MEARPAISSGLFDVAACSAVSSDAFDVEARSAISSGVFDLEDRSAVSSGGTGELGGCITGPSMRPSAWPSIKIQIVISGFRKTKNQDTIRE